MDVGLLLAARLGLDPLSGAPASEPDPSPLPSPPSPPSPAWIRDALAAVARHQRSGQAPRVWPLLRVLEPLLPELGERDPASAGLVIRALATQALVEGDCEAFLQRARRAAEAFERAGDAGCASVERASLGAGYRMLGAWDLAERALRAATALEGGDAARARLDLGRVLAGRGSLAEAQGPAEEAAAIFAAHGDAGGEGVARAWWATILAGVDARASLAEARRAAELLAGSRVARAFSGAALARALLATDEVDEALAMAEQAHEALGAPGRLAEGEAAVRLALADARRAAGDRAGAAIALAEARRGVLADAARLHDPILRRAFLEAIPEHRRALGA